MTTKTWVAADIETKSLVPGHDEYALQPWRVASEEAVITDISIGTIEGESKTIPYTYDGTEELLRELRARRVPLIWFNGIFDLSMLYAAGHDLKDFNHIDAQHLWKWVVNSQHTELGGHSWSLAAAADYWLSDLPWTEEFIEMKRAGHDIAAGENAEYWTERAAWDATATAWIASRAWAKMSPKQQSQAKIEGACLWPNACSYFSGVKVDIDRCTELSHPTKEEMRQIEIRLGVENKGVQLTDDIKVWAPSKILRSPKQLGNLIYNDWGVPIKHRTPKDAPATDKAALTYMADDYDFAIELLRWRELNTHLSKFITTPQAASKYLNSTFLHPQPKIFATYTARMTYKGKLKYKFKTGCALHQWPRAKHLRKLIVPPEGKKLVEFDASGQENRFMAIMSQDVTMLDIFKRKLDIHSYTGSQLAGVNYDSFVKLLTERNEAVSGPSGYRYQGKFNNLSNQYRIGVKKQRIQARVQYGMTVDFDTVKNWQNTYHATYPGVKEYWKSSIRRGRDLGYAETLSGRRYYLNFWDEDSKWSTESSAINFPIQGSGADMKELAVAIITRKYPQLEYAFDLHDALFFYADENISNDFLLEVRDSLDRLPYKEVWNFEPPIPLLWDCQVGPNWGEMVEI